MVKLAWVDVVQWVLGQISTNEKTQQAIFMVKTQQAIISCTRLYVYILFLFYKLTEFAMRVNPWKYWLAVPLSSYWTDPCKSDEDMSNDKIINNSLVLSLVPCFCAHTHSQQCFTVTHRSPIMCRDWKVFSGKLLMRLVLSDLKKHQGWEDLRS